MHWIHSVWNSLSYRILFRLLSFAPYVCVCVSPYLVIFLYGEIVAKLDRT